MPMTISARIWPNNNGVRRLSGWRGEVRTPGRTHEFRAKDKAEAMKKANRLIRQARAHYPELHVHYYAPKWTRRGLVNHIDGASWDSKARILSRAEAARNYHWSD